MPTKNNQGPSEDYPLGGSLEPYDIEREKELTEGMWYCPAEKELISDCGHCEMCPDR